MSKQHGRVLLVGAGPGDPDLLTRAAARWLERADAVLYDALVSDEVLALVRRGAARIAVGKRAEGRCTDQQALHRLMVRLARRGDIVVRLKAGDPSLFGRLAEEIDALAAAGVPFEIVPGITTASAAAARAGFSLSERGVARRVQFITGHLQQDEPLDVDALVPSDVETTTVVYMARTVAAALATRMVEVGWSPSTPVRVMTNVSRSDQLDVEGSLAELAEIVDAMPRQPALVVAIGWAVRQRSRVGASASISDAGLRAGRSTRL